MKKVALHNLGCKVNAYETEAMQLLLEAEGYEVVPFEEKADIYIINTCTVTNIADRKSRQMLHKAKKRNPEALVIAAGCYVQAAGEALKEDSAVDLLVGNNKKGQLISILKEYEKDAVSDSCLTDLNEPQEYEELKVSKTAEHTRAYLKVQDGCNQFCSYCIIPYARGRVRSRKPADVLREVEQLADNGYQEIVLTGIHLSSYGTDFKGEGQDGLLELVLKIHEIEGIKRIRLGSLEPRIITEDFVKTLASLKKVCPHFHLSLQSGCDATLKRMNRHYDTGQYYQKCELLRKYFTHPAITTDVITGFPMETEEEFAQTKKFLEKVSFFEMHIFKYSKRKGTRAAVMENQVEEAVKAERSAVLLALEKEQSKRYREYWLGKTVEILLEDTHMQDGILYRTGHTKEYVKTLVLAENTSENEIIRAQAKSLISEDLLKCERID